MNTDSKSTEDIVDQLRSEYPEYVEFAKIYSSEFTIPNTDYPIELI